MERAGESPSSSSRPPLPMDDILEILNMSSWSDIGGLRNQLEFINPAGAAAEQLGTLNSSSFANPDCRNEAAAAAAAAAAGTDDAHVAAYVESFLSGPPHQNAQQSLEELAANGIGVNCSVMANQSCSSSGFPMLLSGDSSVVMPPSLANPSSSFGGGESARLWPQQPFIGDVQQEQLRPGEMFLNNGAPLFSTRSYRSGNIPSNLRLHREGASGLFSAYGLGQQKPPLQATPRGAYRSAQPTPMAPISGSPRPRVRARRGQATDPHSIAERQRRERIAERMKELQGLVPNANKTDKAIMLDEIIEYVKFLQLQSKIFTMYRMGSSGSPSLAPSSEYSNAMVASLSQSNGTSAENLASLERQAARLMDESMGSALQFLQSKGFCLMPVSMAAALSATKPIHQPIFSSDKVDVASTVITTERPQ